MDGNTRAEEQQSSYFTGERAGFVVTLFLTQLMALFFFVASAIPYLSSFPKSVEKLHDSADLDLIKTIWIRIHVTVSSFNFFLGPVQVSMGLMRKAGTKTHKYIGYTYTIAMVLCIVTSGPLIVLRYIDGGPWTATPLVFLMIYQAVTLVQGVHAIIRGDRQTHRKNMFRNYTGVFVFVTFRMGGILGVAGGFNGPMPSIFMMVTLLLAELILWKYPAAFENNKPDNGVYNISVRKRMKKQLQ
jgi:uncharacterized membrane protein